MATSRADGAGIVTELERTAAAAGGAGSGVGLERDERKISFIVFDSTTSLWVALALAAVAGSVSGFLFGRRHYRR